MFPVRFIWGVNVHSQVAGASWVSIDPNWTSPLRNFELFQLLALTSEDDVDKSTSNHQIIKSSILQEVCVIISCCFMMFISQKPPRGSPFDGALRAW